MANTNISDLTGIDIIDGFIMHGRYPLDKRQVGVNMSYLDELVSSGMAYNGLITYIQSEDAFYKYYNGVWSLNNGSSGTGSTSSFDQSYTPDDIRSILRFNLLESDSSLLIWDKFPTTSNTSAPTQTTVIPSGGTTYTITYFVPVGCVNDYITWDSTIGIIMTLDTTMSSGTTTTESGRINFSENGIYRITFDIPPYGNDGTNVVRTRNISLSLYRTGSATATTLPLGVQTMLVS